jgi:predicted phosphodiesterase
MKVRTLVLSGLIASFSQIVVSSDAVFRVAPYTLKHTNGNLVLNFQTKVSQELIVEDNGVSIVAKIYKKGTHHQIELTPAECGTKKEVKIIHSTSKSILYRNTWASLPCADSANDESFVFGFISDTQEFRERHEDVAKIIAHHHALEPLQFLINGGDIVQEGSVEQQWINYFLGGKAYLLDIPQIAVIGNHDYKGYQRAVMPKFFQQFMRWNGADAFGNLLYDFPGVRFLILNSNFSRYTEREATQVWRWVEEKASRARRDKKPLIIATHFPIYSSSLNKFLSTAVVEMNKKLVPIIEKYKIPMVLSGHTHMYERSLKNGVHYLVAGPAGGQANKPTRKNKYKKVFDKDALTFTKIKLVSKTFKIETYNQDNKMIDSLSFKP